METKNLKELRSLREEQMDVANKAIEEGESDKAAEALKEIKAIDERLKKVEEELDLDKKDEDDKKEDKPVVEKEDDIRSNNTQGETRMNQFKPSVNENKESAEVRGFMEFVRSKGEVRDNVTSVGAEAVIPDDIVTQPVKLPETVTDLKAYANVIKVPTAQGSYPIIESATTKMISVAE
uniref:phage major capsid protein n=1 Tax=Staphylococcus shinii TaxID=2912228 RepID=UPI003F8261F4